MGQAIIIEVRGGVVQDVLNVPPGYGYEIRDYDDIEAEAEVTAGSRRVPTSQDRAGWARNALAAFTAETFTGAHPDSMPRDDLQCALADLIADLLHLARQEGFDPKRILEQGDTRFTIEELRANETTPDPCRCPAPSGQSPEKEAEQGMSRPHFTGDDWVCGCGNQPHTDGFQPCLKSGRLVEPTETTWTDGDLYRCMRCDSIIAWDTARDRGRIAGMTLPEFLGQTEP